MSGQAGDETAVAEKTRAKATDHGASAGRPPGLAPGDRHPDWTAIYRKLPEGELPWHLETLDPDLAAALARYRITAGRVLDVGCGTGTQSAALAARGFEVVGIDVSESAIRAAIASRAGAPAPRRKGGARRPRNPLFAIHDLTRAPAPDQPFNYAFDRGCFHVIAPERRPLFARHLRRSLVDGGLLFLKCFSQEEPGRDWGPERFSLEQAARELAPWFTVLSSESTTFQGPRGHQPRSLFIILAAQPARSDV